MKSSWKHWNTSPSNSVITPTELLAPYAANPVDSKGRKIKEDRPEYRTEYQRDRDRIVHSAAFRRLEYKTQVFVNHEGDMFRTRLTHSVEVAQIARSIARALSLNEDLSEAIALAHDLGHTPFGHAGQEALHQCMKSFGGFEHNFQSLRVVDELEVRYAEFSGLNLTYETREGILKHCAKEKARSLGDLGERFIQRKHPSLEAQLTNLADEIAYNNHDIDDGLRSGLLTIAGMREVELFEKQYRKVVQHYPNLNERRIIHEVIRRMINCQVTDLINCSNKMISVVMPENIDEVRNYGKALIGFSQGMVEQNKWLKRYLREHLYSHYRVLRMTKKASHVVTNLFDAFFDEPRLMPDEPRCLLDESKEPSAKARIIADYIAGMTDRFAVLEHRRLFEHYA